EVFLELGIHAQTALLRELHFAVRVVEATRLQIDDREIVVRLAELRVGSHRRLPLLGRPFGVPTAKQRAAERQQDGGGRLIRTFERRFLTFEIAEASFGLDRAEALARLRQAAD